MKILIFGAGVIGSVFAGRLHDAGQDVTVRARGQRLLDLTAHGLVLEDALSGRRTTRQVPVVDQLGPEAAYDLVMVTTRLEQLEPVLPVLAGNDRIPNILFMLNNPAGVPRLTQALAPARLMLGFPGLGGTRQEEAMRYMLISPQPTTLGELDGRQTPRLQHVAAVFRSAGFPTVFNHNMEAWLKTHAVFVTCVAGALELCGGDSVQLGNTRQSVATIIQAIREGFRALQARQVEITPPAIKIIFTAMPMWFSVPYWQHALRTPTGTLAMAPHAHAARVEMRLLAVEVLALVHASTVSTPTLDQLLQRLTEEPVAG